MAIKRIPKKALNSGYIFTGTALLDYNFTDKEMTIKEWVYKSLGEYLKLCENVQTCYAKEVELVLPASDEADFKIGYSEFTSTVAEILKDKDEIEVGVSYGNTPDKTFIRLDASRLCDYLKENYEKCGTDITVNQTSVLAMLTALEDPEKHSYSEWFWNACVRCILNYHRRFTDPHVGEGEPKITKREAWERLKSEVVYNGTYSIKGYVFPEVQGFDQFRCLGTGANDYKNVRLLHSTLKIVADAVL